MTTSTATARPHVTPPRIPSGDELTRAQKARTRRADRYAQREDARAIAPDNRIRSCGAPLGPRVLVRGSEGGHCSYSHLATCGSVWQCPVCAAKISQRRAEEITQAVSAHVRGGGDVAMMTMTMRHHSGQALAELWDALSYAWRAVTGSSAWTNSTYGDRARFGIDGWTRTVEVTHGVHGWHVHIHALLFAAGGAMAHTPSEELASRVFDRWQAALVRRGLEAPREFTGDSGKRLGVKIDRLCAADTVDPDSPVSVAYAIGNYLTKLGSGAAADPDEKADYAAAMRRAEGMGREVTRGHMKIGRYSSGSGKRSRNPFEIQADAIAAARSPVAAEYRRVHAEAEAKAAGGVHTTATTAAEMETDRAAEKVRYARHIATVKIDAERQAVRRLPAGASQKARTEAQRAARIAAGVEKIESLALWEEWCAASKGRRQQVWSRGLREKLGVGPQRSDAELAAEDEDEDEFFEVTRETYTSLRKGRRLADMLAVAETRGREGVDAWLTAHGLPPSLDPSGWRPAPEDHWHPSLEDPAW